MLDAGAGRVENLLDVLQRLGGLLAGGVSGQLAGRGVDAQLAGHEHEPVGLYRLAVRAQRHRRLRRGDRFHLLAHDSSFPAGIRDYCLRCDALVHAYRVINIPMPPIR